MRRVSFYTLGCRLNSAETALMAEGFRRLGYAIAEHGSPVDVAVINTCTVTDRADARCRNEIRKIQRRSPGALICAVGCYSQAEPGIVASIPGVDLLVGTERKLALAELVEEHVWGASERPCVHVSSRPDAGAFDHPGPGFYPDTTRANIKIQDGCDFCCAFCILPRLRGRGRSRGFEEILEEGRELARRGHRELVVTGVNVGAYRNRGSTLAEVARRLSEIRGIDRIRISSIEPSTVPADLVRWMGESDKACQHLHLPLQSGDDRVLEAMGRVYGVAEYSAFVDEVLEKIPDLTLGTDVIVGYPGESDRSFEKTIRFVEETAFSYLHVFSYSDRPRTVADRLDGKVAARVVKERSEAMRRLAARKKTAWLERWVGREVDVLFESVDADGFRKGLTGSYVRVAIEPDRVAENQLARVRVGAVEGDFCSASLTGIDACA